MLRVFEEAEIRSAITPADAVAAIREAFRAAGLGRTTVPAVINLAIPVTRGEFHVKTAHVAGLRHIAVKVASGFYDPWLVAVDYSQVELRVLAHVTGDEGLIRAFLADEDIHRATAATVYGVQPGDVTRQMRDTAKIGVNRSTSMPSVW